LEYVRCKVRGETSTVPALRPWVRGLKGTIVPSATKEGDFESHGLVVVKGSGSKMVLEVR